MKKLFVLLTALFTLAQMDAQEKNVIRIATDNTDLILQVAPLSLIHISEPTRTLSASQRTTQT